MIYGIKQIHLKTIDVPLRCPKCERESQLLWIFRNFLTIFWIPTLPLRKHFILCCPDCSREREKKEFYHKLALEGKDVEKIKEQLDPIVKEAKTPLYPFLTASLIFALIFSFLGWNYYQEKQWTSQAVAYTKKPTNHFLAVVELGDSFPYALYYISKANDQELVVFESKYVFRSLKDARNVIFRDNGITPNTLKKYFHEPTMISLEDFSLRNIVFVHPAG